MSTMTSTAPMSTTPSSDRPTPRRLDGMRFDGVVLECGKTSGDADTISFADGRFRSSACDRYGYSDGAYTATESEGGIAFEAETESAKYGKLLWRGVVRGPRLDGTLTMMRDGQPAGEKWVLAGRV
ncbi:MAG: hypothetical protein HZC37_18910 [Burkholderiales bacterium]|nr:hypothetical protein [Burkholderiales bacterium]